MARRERNDRLAALLAEAGWSAADLARTVNALGATQGLALRYDRTAVAHWLTGSRPRPPVPDLAALAFSRRCNRLVTAADTGLIQTPQAQASHPSRPLKDGDAVHRLAALCREETDPTRRAFLTKTRVQPVRCGGATDVETCRAAPCPNTQRRQRHAG